MKNLSGLEPLGRAILVEPYEPERKASSIVIPESVLNNERAIDVRARVVAIGPACWPDEPARCSPGDVVMVAKFSGHTAVGVLDGKSYRLVNDRDIFCRLVETL